MSFYFRAFRANDDVGAWKEYMNGHANLLRSFGITNLTSHSEDWITNNDVYVIMAFDSSGTLIGGIKVHGFMDGFQLPVELAIAELDSRISLMIRDSYYNHGVGEICGLWISLDHGRKGLANFLSRAAIALCKRISCYDIYGISSPFTLNMFLQLGYHVIEDLGDNGNFCYPTKEFISTAVKISNTYDLPRALSLNRERIFDLRENPIQTRIETHNGIETEIRYNLFEVLS